jgi:hypothetical protein
MSISPSAAPRRRRPNHPPSDSLGSLNCDHGHAVSQRTFDLAFFAPSVVSPPVSLGSTSDLAMDVHDTISWFLCASRRCSPQG